MKKKLHLYGILGAMIFLAGCKEKEVVLPNYTEQYTEAVVHNVATQAPTEAPEEIIDISNKAMRFNTKMISTFTLLERDGISQYIDRNTSSAITFQLDKFTPWVGSLCLEVAEEDCKANNRELLNFVEVSNTCCYYASRDTEYTYADYYIWDCYEVLHVSFVIPTEHIEKVEPYIGVVLDDLIWEPSEAVKEDHLSYYDPVGNFAFQYPNDMELSHNGALLSLKSDYGFGFNIYIYALESSINLETITSDKYAVALLSEYKDVEMKSFERTEDNKLVVEATYKGEWPMYMKQYLTRDNACDHLFSLVVEEAEDIEYVTTLFEDIFESCIYYN